MTIVAKTNQANAAHGSTSSRLQPDMIISYHCAALAGFLLATILDSSLVCTCRAHNHDNMRMRVKNHKVKSDRVSLVVLVVDVQVNVSTCARAAPCTSSRVRTSKIILQPRLHIPVHVDALFVSPILVTAMILITVISHESMTLALILRIVYSSADVIPSKLRGCGTALAYITITLINYN